MPEWFYRGGDALIPAEESSTAAVRKLADGQAVRVNIVAPRSVHWHRKYFGICRDIGENQDPARDESSIDMELRVLAGHFESMHVRKGNELYEVRTPKRIAFDRLRAEEWEKLWPSLELAIRERFGSEYLNQTF
ncbi:MAG: hypothetical protein ACR2K1_04370 [Saprospiraceae bacterium]